MIGRWLRDRREAAGYRWLQLRALRGGWSGSPDLARAHRVFARWDRLLDWWTGER